MILSLLTVLTVQCPDGSPPPCARAARPAAVSPNSVAVLYFESRTRDTTDTFLADGITEELITRLAQVGRLDVKSRFESQRARGQSRDIATLGRNLRASYLVTGTLQQSGQNVRLNVALVRASTGSQVWGNAYGRSGGDLLTIQSDIASEVATAIAGQLLPAERSAVTRRPTRDPLAYDLYLRGVGAINSLTESSVRSGLDYLDRAVARDSTFVDAWVQRSMAWVMMADGYVDGRTGYDRARADALQALRFDPANAMALALISQAVLTIDHDPGRALRLADSALARDPRNNFAMYSRALPLLILDQSDAAADAFRRAWLADTLWVPTTVMFIYSMSHTGRFAELRAAMPRLTPVMTPDVTAYAEGQLALAAGDAAAARRHFDWKWYGGLAAGEYARALVQLGRRDELRAVIDSMHAERRRSYFNAYAIAGAFAAAGDADSTIAWLGHAADERTSWVLGAPTDAVFAPYRSDPRFVAFLNRIRGR